MKTIKGSDFVSNILIPIAPEKGDDVDELGEWWRGYQDCFKDLIEQLQKQLKNTRIVDEALWDLFIDFVKSRTWDIQNDIEDFGDLKPLLDKEILNKND